MIQSFRTGLVVRWLAALSFIAGPLCLAAHAAPPQPPPAPTGTIYYRNGNTYYAVKPNGTGQAANILPNVANLVAPGIPDINPAFSPSGGNATHDRWWICAAVTGVYDHQVNPDGSVIDDVPHRDLFAVRSDPTRTQLITVQLTDLYGIANIFGFSCWSNDGNNDIQSSFVMAVITDIRGAFVEEEDGTTVIDGQTQKHNLRLPLAISEIQPGYVPFGPDTWADEAELDAMLYSYTIPVGYAFGSLNFQGKFAPSGSFYLKNTAVAQGRTQLFIADWTPTSTGDPWLILWDGRNGVPTTPWTANWSPDGQSIAMEDRGQGQPGGGSIYTQPASGASAPKMVLNISVKGGKITTYSNPVWSPDNKYLVVVKKQFTGSTLTGAWLTRLTVSDGKTLDLAPIADGTKPLRWTADN